MVPHVSDYQDSELYIYIPNICLIIMLYYRPYILPLIRFMAIGRFEKGQLVSKNR